MVTILCHSLTISSSVVFAANSATFRENEITGSEFPAPILQKNEPPVITGQSALSMMEDESITIAPDHLQVTDPDNTWPQGFTIHFDPGKNYSVSGTTITPAPDFSGTLDVKVKVNDGEHNSPPFNLEITVTPVNDPPFISGQTPSPLTTAEETGIIISVANLLISDPDNDSHTLSILAGQDYSVSGDVVTPVPGFNGDLTVPVFVSDGAATSNQYNLIISVSAVNDPPSITGQRDIQIEEDTQITLSLADVTASDTDNVFPEGFTLSVRPGDNYASSGNLVTPAPDFTGVLYVNVVVNDGASNSEPYPLLITVTPVNDAPVIDSQNEVTTAEETPRTIALTDLVVSDPDNAYPAGFTLLALTGTNYTLDGNTILPVPDFSGVLTVPVQVSDGEFNSNVFSLKVTVTPANDKPVIVAQVPVSTQEDDPVTIQLLHLTVLDSDNSYPADFTLFVEPGTNYSVNGTTVRPAPDFNGTLNVVVTVSDGTDTSEPFAFQIQVGDSNDAPTITGQLPLSTNEEQPVTITLSQLLVTDPDNAYPAGFSLEISPGNNYTVTENTITPAINFAGILTVPVRVNDGVNNSPSFDFKLQVNQVNDPPSFAAIPNQQVAENTPAGSLTIRQISKGPNENDQQLTFIATSGNTAVIPDPVIQYNGGNTAVLSYSINPNTSGVVTLTVVAVDNGDNTPPHQNSFSFSFQVEVLPINSPPTLDPLNDLSIMEDSEQQNVTLNGITAGPGEDQPLTVTVSTNKPAFFQMLEVAYTSPSVTGLLQFKTNPDVSGTAEISVKVMDNGSGVAPHANSITRKFTVTIQPVNDPPVFSSQPLMVAVLAENYKYNIEVSDPDGDKLSVSAVTKPSWATLTQGGNGKAILQGTPPQGSLGDFATHLTATDGTSTIDQTFVIYVNVRPEIQDLKAAVEEDTPFTFSEAFFTAGYSDQNGNPLLAIQVAALPGSGVLDLAGEEVKAGDTIQTSSLGQLTYTPSPDFSGSEFFIWNGWDGYHFSGKPARVDISIIPVNDPPRVVLLDDTLRYEVDGESAFLASMLEIEDPDDDTLTRAMLVFQPGTYRPQMDLLEIQATPNIRAHFDLQNGILELTGTATMEEYKTALRSVRYTYLNTIDPILEPKVVSFLLSDDEAEGTPTDKVIILQYTFVEFEIPSAFTPNGDHANDTWVIDRPGGGLEEMDNAIIRVYNKQGVLVYSTKGFGQPWDGTMNGELLPADTYFFTIDLQLRNKKTYKGIVTILR